MDTVIVSRHAATVQYLIEAGIAPATARVLKHVTPEEIRGQHVIANPPLALAALAKRVTTVPLPRPQRNPQGRMEELDLAAGLYGHWLDSRAESPGLADMPHPVWRARVNLDRTRAAR